MNHYRTSDGQRVSKRYIDGQIRKAKAKKLQEQKDNNRDGYYNYCEDCGMNGSFTFLDCSHDVSVNECQKQGRSELAWDVSNITIRCRTCHQEYDKNDVQL